MTDAKHDDGGSAFPLPDLSSYGMGPRENMSGMSLRDYFAAAALQGLLAAPLEGASFGSMTSEQVRQLFAKGAYEYADAMLEARKRKPE